jgi:hypothetical protein
MSMEIRLAIPDQHLRLGADDIEVHVWDHVLRGLTIGSGWMFVILQMTFSTLG